MKKSPFIVILALLLCVAMLAACAQTQGVQGAPAETAAPAQPVAPAASETPAETENTLPQIGEVVGGFKVLSVEPVNVLGATGVLFEHEKSGAKLYYLASEDTNRSFDISFRTPALDDKGKPHVFEHITICGSQKYPDANLFFPFINITYSTFVNAFTYHGMTTFPVASLSEDQLISMMDYYLSGVFMPLLYTEPRMAQREAWRYELSDVNEPLTIAGTVYSEMQGALTAERLAMTNNLRALYSGSPVAHESGGEPEAIRTLSYEELVAFHDAYYHPSNALITLYGKLDYVKFLEYIDKEYLSAYDRKDVDVEMGRIEPYTETQYAVYEAPVEADANTKDASYIYYSFGLDKASLADTMKADVLAGVLNSDSLPFMRAMLEKLPNAKASVGVSFDSPTPYITFTASGVNEADRDVFVGIVDEAIAQLAQNGIPQDELDSILARAKLSLMLTGEDQDLGVDASMTSSLAWVYFDTPNYYNEYEKAINEADQSSLTAFLKTWLCDNSYRAVSVTKPVAGLAEKNASALEEELAKVKASMSKEEVEALAAEYSDFSEWSGKDPDPQILNKLVGVTVESLPEEVQHFDIKEKTEDGVRYLTAATTLSGVEQTHVLLDASTLPIDKLQDVNAYLLLLGELDTASHSKEELSTLITRYLPKFSADLEALSPVDESEDLYAANLSWQSLTEDYSKSVELMREIVNTTKFDDAQTIQAILTRTSNGIRDSLDQEPLSMQVSRTQAVFLPTSAYTNYISGLEYYDYLSDMTALCESDPAAFAARMEEARSLILNKSDATVLFAGDEEAIAAAEGVLPGFFADMTDTKREKVDYSALCLKFSKEILTNNMTVHMNVVLAPSNGYTGKDAVVSSLINDVYMLPRLRNVGGAYGAYSEFSNHVDALYTYRDPNCAKTLDAYKALPEFLRTADISQDMVDRYIIGAYSGLSRPKGALSGALTALQNSLRGVSEETKLTWQKEAKATTIEDVRGYADVIEGLLQNGVYSSSGSPASFAGDEKLFDSTIRLGEGQNELKKAA